MGKIGSTSASVASSKVNDDYTENDFTMEDFVDNGGNLISINGMLYTYLYQNTPFSNKGNRTI